VIVLVIFLIVRKPVKELIPKLRSYEGLGQKLAFGEQLADAEETAAAAVGEADGPVESGEPSPLIREAEQNPSYVIISAWERLYASLRESAAGVARLPTYKSSNAHEMAQALLSNEVVNAEFVRAVGELRNLRNRVAHGQHNPTPGEAITYAETVEELARAVEAAATRRSG
jgi:hypothetical protein